MRKSSLCTAGGVAMLLLGGSAANAAGVADLAKAFTDKTAGTIIQRVHSPYEAKQTLYGLGYYDVHVERTSLPYSFNACKRGLRYHIHVNYYGDLVQVDKLGPCRGYRYDDDDYRSGPYYRKRYRYYRNGRYGY